LPEGRRLFAAVSVERFLTGMCSSTEAGFAPTLLFTLGEFGVTSLLGIKGPNGLNKIRLPIASARPSFNWLNIMIFIIIL
jgi:hypothetical protein